jgi:hypothetical protein
MNAVDSDTQAALDRYLAGVRAALADLPEDVRDELLEDLPAHFAEILSEHEGSLEERLGPPAAYAADLRAAAGLDAVTGPRRGSERLASAVERTVRFGQVADVRVGSWLGYPKASEFVRQLRPAWFVLRGFVVGVLLFQYGPLGHEHLRDPFGWLVLLAMIVLSVRVGPISHRLPRWLRYGLGAAVALLVTVMVINLAGFRPYESYGGPSYVRDNRWDQVTDVYPYDSNGNPLHDVTLYDQNGDPLIFGDYWRCVDKPDQPGPMVAPKYPLCKGPRVVPPGLGPSSGPSPSAASPSAASPSTAGPSGAASASVTPSR